MRKNRTRLEPPNISLIGRRGMAAGAVMCRFHFCVDKNIARRRLEDV